MKKILFLACLALGVSACEKDPDLSNLDGNMVVYTDYDNGTDFSAYTTYFLPDSILEAGAIRASYWKDENAQTLIKEVEANLNSRGYTRITDPEKKDEADFGVQLSYIAETTQVVTGGYWNGWWRLLGPLVGRRMVLSVSGHLLVRHQCTGDGDGRPYPEAGRRRKYVTDHTGGVVCQCTGIQV